MRKKLYSAVIVFLMVIFASCGEYNKVVKGSDYDLKYKKAFEYYENKKFSKALQLFEQILPIYKGMDKGEKVMYYYTLCNYRLKDYYLAGYYFRKFVQTYPYSPYSEEAMYYGAYCYYLDSPKSSLDQESTNMAIQEFEMYLSKYPNTLRKDTCNTLLDELRFKLQKKSYDNAYLYYKLGYYKASTISLKNSLKDYPDSPFKEEILYYTAKGSYLYADKSILEKKYDRFQDAKKDLEEYLKYYSAGKYQKDVNKMLASSQQNIKDLPVKK